MFWLMKQTWANLLFLHWELESEKLKPLLPIELALDTFDGKAWLTILPFRVRHQRFHGLPEIPMMRAYLELNVRTYVVYKGVPGVYFFSLDANNLLSVAGAKAGALPYRMARMEMTSVAGGIRFTSKRVFGNGEFAAAFAPAGPAVRTVSGSLDAWLLERYVLFTKLGPWVLRGDIRHESWEVRSASVRVEKNTAAPFGVSGHEPRLVHYADRKEAYIYPLRKGSL